MTLLRRQFLASLSAVIGASSLTANPIKSAEAESSRSRQHHFVDDDKNYFIKGYCFARRQGNHDQSNASFVDFWTGRFRDQGISLEKLHTSTNLIYVYDDLFVRENLVEDFQKVIAEVRNYCDFDPTTGENSFSSYLKDQNELSAIIRTAARNSFNSDEKPRIALVDTCSWGMTLSWNEILPHLAHDYSQIITFERHFGRGPMDGERFYGEPNEFNRYENALKLGGVHLETSDALLGFNAFMHGEEFWDNYAPVLTSFVSSLTRALAHESNALHLTTLARGQRYAVGLTLAHPDCEDAIVERQRRLVRDHMYGIDGEPVHWVVSDPEDEHPIALTFWPLSRSEG